MSIKMLCILLLLFIPSVCFGLNELYTVRTVYFQPTD